MSVLTHINQNFRHSHFLLRDFAWYYVFPLWILLNTDLFSFYLKGLITIFFFCNAGNTFEF